MERANAPVLQDRPVAAGQEAFLVVQVPEVALEVQVAGPEAVSQRDRDQEVAVAAEPAQPVLLVRVARRASPASPSGPSAKNSSRERHRA